MVATWLRYRAGRSDLFSASACPFFLSFPLFIIFIFIFVLVLVFAANGNREDRLAGEKG